MSVGDGRSLGGIAGTELVLEVFRAHGLLMAAGDRLASANGLTSARWQVLGAIALAGEPSTVPRVARRMGLTRQSVQASVNRLVSDGLLESGRNLDHRRSPLFGLTARGFATYAELDRRQAGWINELVDGLPLADLEVVTRVLAELSGRMAGSSTDGSEEGEPS